jgi:hemerythrin-like domain-containing protein
MPDDAITVLTHEHQQLEELFERVSRPDEDRREVLKELMQLIAAHVAVEKQMVVPLVKDRIPIREGDLAEELKDTHNRIERILTLLERRKVNSPDVPDLVNEMLQVTEQHIAHANEALFPALRQALRVDELDDLGQRLISNERRRLTHPHPVAHDSGPVASVMHKANEAIDAIRDRSADIGRTST